MPDTVSPYWLVIVFAVLADLALLAMAVLGARWYLRRQRRKASTKSVRDQLLMGRPRWRSPNMGGR